jgi:hypothetical protein
MSAPASGAGIDGGDGGARGGAGSVGGAGGGRGASGGAGGGGRASAQQPLHALGQKSSCAHVKLVLLAAECRALGPRARRIGAVTAEVVRNRTPPRIAGGDDGSSNENLHRLVTA